MPTNFIFNAEEMQGNTTVSPFISPVAPAENKIASQLASAGKQLVTDVQSNKLRDDLNTESAAFIAAQKQSDEDLAARTNLSTDELYTEGDFDEISASEKSFMDQTQNEAAKLKRAHAQGRLTSNAFRAKTESLLKSRINQTPGLTEKLRRVAADTLGFDPTGFDIKNAMDEADARNTADKSEVALRLSVVKDMAKAGFYEDGLSIDGIFAKYYAPYQEALVAENAEKLLAQQKSDKNTDFQYTQRYVMNQTAPSRYVKANKNIEKVMNTAGIKGTSQLTDADIKDMPKAVRDDLINQLQAEKIALATEQQRKYFALSGDERNTATANSVDAFNNQIKFLKGDISAAVLANINKNKMARAMAGVIEDDRNALYFAAIDNYPPGMKLQPELQIEANRIFTTLMGNGAAAGTNVVTAAIKALTDNGVSESSAKLIAGGHLTQYIRGFNAYTDKERTPEVIQSFVDELTMFSETAWNPDPDSTISQVGDALFEAASKESFDAVMKYLQDTGDVKLLNQIRAVGVTYIPKVMRGVNSKINSYVNSDKGWYEMSVNDDGLINFELSSSAVEWFAQEVDPNDITMDDRALEKHATDREVQKNMAELNNKFSPRLNNLVAASARIGGSKNIMRTAEFVLGRHLEQVPLSPQFRDMLEAQGTSRTATK